MTGILQNFARKHQKAIDFLKFKFIIKPQFEKELSLVEAPDDGVIVYGLHLEQAKWDSVNQCIVEQEPG